MREDAWGKYPINGTILCKKAFVPIVLLISIFGTAVYFGMSQHPEPHKPAPRGRLSHNLSVRRHQERSARRRKRQHLFRQFLVQKQQEKATKEDTKNPLT